MTHRIKPLVWEESGKFSLIGRGFAGYATRISFREDGRFKIELHGIGVLRPTLEMAKELLEAEYQEWLSAAIEPTDPLADAMELPEIKALVDAAKDLSCIAENFGWETALIDRALAALTKEGE